MGSLSSVITPILSVGKIFSNNSARQRDIKEINIKNRQLEQNAVLQKQSNLLSLQQKESDRLSRLRRSISAQRANFAGQGIGSVTGSADSVLQGLNEESDIERQNNQSKSDLEARRIDDNYKGQRQLNLLQKQQLKQKSALSFITDLVG